MAITALAFLVLAPSWSDVWHKIEDCQTIDQLSSLNRRLKEQRDRCSQVGSAVCLYYLDAADKPQGNGASVLFSALKLKGRLTAEELVWRYKLSRIFTEPDIDSNLQPLSTVVLNGKAVPIYNLGTNEAADKRSEDIKDALHNQFPGSIEDQYIQTLFSRDPATTVPRLKKLLGADRLWRYDVQWSIESRSSMLGTADKAGRKSLNSKSVIYKIRFNRN